MKIDGYDALSSACNKRWCWRPGNYQHRGACGSGGSRNTGMTTRCCLERAYRGCPDPVPEPGAPAATLAAEVDRLNETIAKLAAEGQEARKLGTHND